ncbi:hypothetical protein PSENEW3n2_00003979, partial [Picochlorum sp. SENEW3]
MSSEGFRKILEFGQCRRSGDPAPAFEQQYYTEWHDRENELKDYLMASALDGTRTGNVVKRLRASLEGGVGARVGIPAFDECKWHQLLYRIGDRQVAARGDLMDELGGDVPEPLVLTSAGYLYEDAWLKANPDIDTLEVFSNRLDVFNTVCITPTETFEKIQISQTALQRGRAVIFPSGSPDAIPHIQLLAGPLKTHHHGRGDSDISAFKKKHYLGTIAHQQHSSLFVSQMVTDLSSPVDVVAFDLVLDYIIAIKNGDVSGQIGQSSAGATRRSSTRTGVNRSGEEAAYSADLSGDVMRALDSNEGIEAFLSLRQAGLGALVREAAGRRRSTLTIEQVMSNLRERGGRRLLMLATGVNQADDDNLLAEETCKQFRLMLKNLWFSGTIQLSRIGFSAADCSLHLGSDDRTDSEEDAQQRLRCAATSIAEVVKMYVRPPKSARADIYIVPSIGLELIMEKLDNGRWVHHTEHSGYFPERKTTDQRIRLHVPRWNLKSVQDGLTTPTEGEERPPRGHFHLYSTWGNSSGPGPSGAKFQLHENTDLNRLEREDCFGVDRVLRPQPIQTWGDQGHQQVSAEEARPQGEEALSDNERESGADDGAEENTRRFGKYAPVLSVYETYNRSFDNQSMFKDNQRQYKDSLIQLGVPGAYDTKHTLCQMLADYVGAFGRTIDKFLDGQPKPTPLRFEDVSVMHYRCEESSGEDRTERDSKFVEAVREHVLGRQSKLTSIRFSDMLSYSHHDEYPSLVRSLKGWMDVLWLRAYLEINHHAHCSYQ